MIGRMGIGVGGESTRIERRRRWTAWARRAVLAAAAIVVAVVGEIFARTTEEHPGTEWHSAHPKVSWRNRP